MAFFDTVMTQSAAADLFRLFGGDGRVEPADGGDPITKYVFELVEAEEVILDRAGHHIDTDALLVLPESQTFDLTNQRTSRVTIFPVLVGGTGVEWHVIAETEAEAGTRSWALTRSDRKTISNVTTPKRRRS